MKKLPLISGISAIICGASLIAFRIIRLFSTSREADNIGIIGGADAPTAIFLTSRLGLFNILGIAGILGITALIAGIALVILSIITHTKKPED